MKTACDCFLSLPEPPPIKFPSCNCEKCQRLRADGKSEQLPCDGVLQNVSNYDCDNLMHSMCDVAVLPTVADSLTLGGVFSRFSYNFRPENIYSMLFDVIGTLAFVIMATFTFWFIICVNLWNMVLTIAHSGRKIQVLTIVLLALLLTCIVFHAISGHKIKRLRRETAIIYPYLPNTIAVNDTSIDSRAKIANSSSNTSLKSLCARKSCHKCPSTPSVECETDLGNTVHQKDSHHRESGGTNSCNTCGKLKKRASESLCDLCAKKFGSKTIISDDEARKAFQTSQLYAIPTEWKSVPSPIVFIDYLISMFTD